MSCWEGFLESFACCPLPIFRKVKGKRTARKYETDPDKPPVTPKDDPTSPDTDPDKQAKDSDIKPSPIEPQPADPEPQPDDSKPEAEPQPAIPSVDLGDDEDGDFLRQFESVAGVDGEIDAYELQQLLNETYNAEEKFAGFSEDMCKSLVAMRDSDLSGMLGYYEAKDLWEKLKIWKRAFRTLDCDMKGYIYGYEFDSVLRHVGVDLSRRSSMVVMSRYSDQEGKVHFDDFILCMARLTTTVETYKRLSSEQNSDRIEMKLPEFLQETMYA